MDWATAVSSAVGGKAGGKGATSVGNGTNIDKVDEGVRLAQEYLEKFHARMAGELSREDWIAYNQKRES